MSHDALELQTGAAGGGSLTPHPADAVKTHLLDDGYPVAAEFLAAVRAQVEFVLPGLIPRIAYTTENLCGSAFWELLSRSEKSIAGRCLAHLVAHGVLALVHVPGKHEYPRRYRRR